MKKIFVIEALNIYLIINWIDCLIMKKNKIMHQILNKQSFT